jgi:thymidylate synthase
VATKIDLPDLRTGYVDLVELVLRDGRPVSPRGLPIVELSDVTFTVGNLRDVLPLGVGRKINPKLAALEALQLIAAEDRPDYMLAVSDTFRNFMEDGRFWGSHGRRVGGQASDVLRKLLEDRDSRQAVLTFWDHSLDNVPGKRNYPCAVALGFRIRDDRLNLSTLMRSNDLWLGTPYDVFQFVQLQHTLAHELGVEAGTYTHTAWSLHVYERDLERASLLQRSTAPTAFNPAGVRAFPDLTPYQTLDYRALATDLLDNPGVHLLSEDAHASELWYQRNMLRVHRENIEKQ